MDEKPVAAWSEPGPVAHSLAHKRRRPRLGAAAENP